jgi:uncharacterized protein with HEPN domain
MQPKSSRLLEHIRDAAAFIRAVTLGKTIDAFQSDRLLRQAVERNFEIIGEAIGRLARDDQPTAARISNIGQIIAFRNILIHGYELIDHARVWQVIVADLPQLESEVAALLSEQAGP